MPRMTAVFRDAWLIAGKDLRIEMRSRVGLNQIVPFAVTVLVLFAFALDTDQEALRTYAPGLFWLTVLLASLLAIGRSFAVDLADGRPTGCCCRESTPSRCSEARPQLSPSSWWCWRCCWERGLCCCST